jgi:hypothetical protein
VPLHCLGHSEEDVAWTLLKDVESHQIPIEGAHSREIVYAQTELGKEPDGLVRHWLRTPRDCWWRGIIHVANPGSRIVPLLRNSPQNNRSTDYPLESGLSPLLHCDPPMRPIPRPVPIAHRAAFSLLDVEGIQAGPPVARTGV